MFRKSSLARDSRGQSLIETALMLPLLLTLILNAVNFGYFVWITLNLTSAARNATQYATAGSSTPRNASLPIVGDFSTANTVSALIAQDAQRLPNFATNGTVDVCTVGGSSYKPCTITDTDPEAANGFALNRVDVSYTFTPPIDAPPFTLGVLSTPVCTLKGGKTSCTLSRHVEMRAMGS